MDLDEGYNYLVFDCQKRSDSGRLEAYVYGEDGSEVGRIEKDYSELDNEIHQYVIDLSAVSGKVTVELGSNLPDSAGGSEPDYQFSNIFMY